MKNKYSFFFAIAALLAFALGAPAAFAEDFIKMDPVEAHGRHINSDDIPPGSTVITIINNTNYRFWIVANGHRVTLKPTHGQQSDIPVTVAGGFPQTPLGKQLFLSRYLTLTLVVTRKDHTFIVAQKKFDLAEQFSARGWNGGVVWKIDEPTFKTVTENEYKKLILGATSTIASN